MFLHRGILRLDNGWTTANIQLYIIHGIHDGIVGAPVYRVWAYA